MYDYEAIVTNVVDGDTFDLTVDLGFKIYHKIRARLLGIDTPEKFGEERELGEKCKQIAEKYWLNKNVIIHSEKDKDINTDSFGRWLIHIVDIETGIDANTLYYNLGINKLSTNYSAEKVMQFKL